MNTANITKPKKESSQTKTIKLVIFPVSNLNFALDIDTVQKVVNYSIIFGSGLNHFGLVNIGNQEITVIDLHKRLFHTPQALDSDEKKYLILAKNSVDELFGIVINETPTLFDAPLNNIRTLPASYRHSDTLAIASHVTVIPDINGDLTIFILDPDELIKPIS